MFRGNLPYRLLGQNFYPLHRFRLSKSRHRFPRNTLTLISHIITTGSPVLLSDIVTDVATNRIYTGFSPHLHCRTQKRPCQSGRNSEPTKSFSYTYLLRVLPQISCSCAKFLTQILIFCDTNFSVFSGSILRKPIYIFCVKINKNLYIKQHIFYNYFRYRNRQ